MPAVKILLVEDEPVVAFDLCLMLQHRGHEVWIANHPAEALSLCSAHRPDAAILNIRYPERTDGMALARSLKAICPLTVFFITGAQQEDLVSAPDFQSDCEILLKPFTAAQFKSLLAQNLP